MSEKTIIDKNLLIERIEELCKSRKENITTAFFQSGVGKNFKSNLKTANASMGKITMLANYFGVSVDYLLGKEEKPTNEGELLEDVIIFHRNGKTVKKQFTKEQMEMITKMLDAIPEKPKDI